MSTERARVRRKPERGAYDAATIREILDENIVCHVGINSPEGPVVLPTLFGRDGDFVYLHGSVGAHMLRSLRDGVPVCVAVTSVNGIVAARSHFHHSINYRSVVIFGITTEVTDVQEKLHGMEVLTNHVLPGRWEEARQPNTAEFTQTMVLKLSLAEASAKVRVGPPGDDEADMQTGFWAGVIPLAVSAGQPEPDSAITPGAPLPPSVVAALERWRPPR